MFKELTHLWSDAAKVLIAQDNLERTYAEYVADWREYEGLIPESKAAYDQAFFQADRIHRMTGIYPSELYSE